MTSSSARARLPPPATWCKEARATAPYHPQVPVAQLMLQHWLLLLQGTPTGKQLKPGGAHPGNVFSCPE